MPRSFLPTLRDASLRYICVMDAGFSPPRVESLVPMETNFDSLLTASQEYFYAKVVCDSLAPSGCRLTTMEARYPRFIHAEVMTHRVLSRNAASSRAIPVRKMIDQVREHPALFTWWGKAQKGMQAREELTETERNGAIADWLWGRDQAIEVAERLLVRGMHKQNINRALEPYAWITVILSATTWDNFFRLRTHADAQPELQSVARLMQTAYEDSVPQILAAGEWHTPYLQPDEYILPLDQRKAISTGRCARVSYLTHAGTREIQADIDLHDRLKGGPESDPDEPGHWSPFEHIAEALSQPEQSGNFTGWRQYRKAFLSESGVK